MAEGGSLAVRGCGSWVLPAGAFVAPVTGAGPKYVGENCGPMASGPDGGVTVTGPADIGNAPGGIAPEGIAPGGKPPTQPGQSGPDGKAAGAPMGAVCGCAQKLGCSRGNKGAGGGLYKVGLGPYRNGRQQQPDERIASATPPRVMVRIMGAEPPGSRPTRECRASLPVAPAGSVP